MITVEVTPESIYALRVRLDKAHEGVRKGLSAGIHKAIIRLSTIIKQDYLSGQVINRRSGNLSRAVVPRMIDNFTGIVIVGAEAPYARFLNDGSRPHIIEAINAKALRFSVGGDFIFRKRVMHPGTKATHFMERALEGARVEITQIIAERVNRGVKGDAVE